MKEELLKGKVLPLKEEFYSIQGEGFNTGEAAYFIRVAGCNIGCEWCDEKDSWNAENFPLVEVDTIVENVLKNQTKSVVFTGGEPLMYNLDYACELLKKNNIKTFLETSGTYPITGKWDWICLSPKLKRKPLKENYSNINELKVVIYEKSDLLWAEENAKFVDDNCYLFLQPEWSKFSENIKFIIDYILKNPKWRISLQIHKYLNIK